VLRDNHPCLKVVEVASNCHLFFNHRCAQLKRINRIPPGKLSGV
jgi:hypothetical protein